MVGDLDLRTVGREVVEMGEDAVGEVGARLSLTPRQVLVDSAPAIAMVGALDLTATLLTVIRRQSDRGGYAAVSDPLKVFRRWGSGEGQQLAFTCCYTKTSVYWPWYITFAVSRPVTTTASP